MYLGRIVEVGKNNSIYQKPYHPYTKALLYATPIADPLKKRKETFIEGDVPSPINLPSGCVFHPRCIDRKDICIHTAPKLEQVQNDHWVSCHLV
jgi:oligopeptide/dipeptide ABC transporter ATP-binding protein